MTERLLRVPAKRVRAEIIRRHCWDTYPGVVCFTCGNAADALRDVGLSVIEVGPRGVLNAPRWWTPSAVRRSWPHLFDATSGHLPSWMLVAMAQRWRELLTPELGPMLGVVYVPSGSGETAITLALAYPSWSIVPVFNLDAATEWEPQTPLLPLMEALCGPPLLKPGSRDWIDVHAPDPAP